MKFNMLSIDRYRYKLNTFCWIVYTRESASQSWKQALWMLQDCGSFEVTSNSRTIDAAAFYSVRMSHVIGISKMTIKMNWSIEKIPNFLLFLLLHSLWKKKPNFIQLQSMQKKKARKKMQNNIGWLTRSSKRMKSF